MFGFLAFHTRNDIDCSKPHVGRAFYSMVFGNLLIYPNNYKFDCQYVFPQIAATHRVIAIACDTMPIRRMIINCGLIIIDAPTISPNGTRRDKTVVMPTRRDLHSQNSESSAELVRTY